jgi:serine/threonine protein phosphatase PrpC
MDYKVKVGKAVLEHMLSLQKTTTGQTTKKKRPIKVPKKAVEKLLSSEPFVQACEDLEKAAMVLIKKHSESKKPAQKTVADIPKAVKEDVEKLAIDPVQQSPEVVEKQKISYVNDGRPINVRFRVPNLTVGVPFKEALTSNVEIEGVANLSLVNTGLDMAVSSIIKLPLLEIEGVFENHGEHIFEMEGSIALPNGQIQRCHASLRIIVNPDPKSLWKNTPTDVNAKHNKPDLFTASQETETAILIGASARGRSHAHKGTHRDDDFFIDSTTDWNILAVADGAGSCKFSRKGAELAVQKSTAYLKDMLSGALGLELEDAYAAEHKMDVGHQIRLKEVCRQTIVPAVYEAVKAISEAVDLSAGETVKDFSTTLLLVAHKQCKDGHLVMSFWIGDGAVALYDNNSMVQLMGTPDSGEFAGQTRFLNEKIIDDGSIHERISIEKKERLTAIILATDGITDAKFETERQLESLDSWDAMWAEIGPIVEGSSTHEAEEGLLHWMEFWSPGNHDDRTISLCLVK